MYRSHLLAVMTGLLVTIGAALAIGPDPAAATTPAGAPEAGVTTASQGSCTEAPNSPNTFPDIPDDSVFCNDIAWMVSSGITQGRVDGTFGPGEPVRRGHMAAFLYRFADEPVVPDSAPSFSDVPRSHVFHREISWLAAEGISLGRGDGTFLPNDTLTRGQMAAFLYRYAGEPEVTEEGLEFFDVPSSHRFADAVAWMASTGITTGQLDGSFGINEDLNRSQMSAFLYRYALALLRERPSDDLTQPAEWELETGDVQVTLLWTGGEDLELRVVEPNGGQINADVRVSDSGGVMDRAERPDCAAVDGLHGENVHWPAGTAPQGEYEAFVTTADGCDYTGWFRLEVRLDGVLVDSVSAPTDFDRSDEVDARIVFSYPPSDVPDVPDVPDDPADGTGDGVEDIDRQAATYLSLVATVDRSGSSSWSTGSARVDTTDYARSLTTFLMSSTVGNRWQEYDLNRAYDRFRVTVGIDDLDAKADAELEFVIYADGQVAAVERVRLGQAIPLDIDASGVLRLRLEVNHVAGGRARGVFGNPRLVTDDGPDDAPSFERVSMVEEVRYLSERGTVDRSGSSSWSTGSARVDTIDHTRSLTTFLMSSTVGNRWQEYDLNRAYDRFRVTVGIDDLDAKADAELEFVIYSDGQVAATERLPFASSVDLDIDATDVLRVRVEVNYLNGGRARGVFANPRAIQANSDDTGSDFEREVSNVPLVQFSQVNTMDRSSSSAWSTGTAKVDGTDYTRSLTSFLMSSTVSNRWQEYDLNRGYELLRTTVGVEDSGSSDAVLEFVVYADGRVAERGTVGFGVARMLEVDVSGAMRVRLEVNHLAGGSARGVFGNARALSDASVSDG